MGFLMSFSGHDSCLVWPGSSDSSVASIHTSLSGRQWCMYARSAAAASPVPVGKALGSSAAPWHWLLVLPAVHRALRLWFYLCVPRAVTFLCEWSPQLSPAWKHGLPLGFFSEKVAGNMFPLVLCICSCVISHPNIVGLKPQPFYHFMILWGSNLGRTKQDNSSLLGTVLPGQLVGSCGLICMSGAWGLVAGKPQSSVDSFLTCGSSSCRAWLSMCPLSSAGQLGFL